MHCKSCDALIEDRLPELEGVEKAEASFADEKVKVVFDDTKISQDKIEGELKKIGFPPHHSSPEKKSMKFSESSPFHCRVSFPNPGITSSFGDGGGAAPRKSGTPSPL